MNSRERQNLDRFITGNFGEDQLKGKPEPEDDELSDEWDDETKQWGEGFDAYESGATMDANPYHPKSEEHKDWNKGYKESMDSDME